jgi:hypothetical protein
MNAGTRGISEVHAIDDTSSGYSGSYRDFPTKVEDGWMRLVPMSVNYAVWVE